MLTIYADTTINRLRAYSFFAINTEHAFHRHSYRTFAKKRIFLILIICMIILWVPGTAPAEDNHSHHDSPSHDMKHSDTGIHPTYPDMFDTREPVPAPTDAEAAGITEKLGEIIPGDIRFLDENGNILVLSDFIDRPTLILPVFYHCPRTCSLLLANLARALNDVTFAPGESYRVISFSFDEVETPSDAAYAKKNYLNLLRRDFPASAWRFITGDLKNINTLSETMGFQFKRLAPHSFVHPNILLCVGPDRKIIRYLYGPDFLPFDISMAIAEAERGTPGISIKKIVSLCFAYDPKGKRYVFKTFRISGVIIISLLAVFILFLVRKKPSGQKEQ